MNGSFYAKSHQFFGTLVDVDWQYNFNSFFEVIRFRLSFRDASKIPKERTFGINRKFYKLLFEVEPLTQVERDGENMNDNNEDLHIGGHDIQSDAGTSHRTEDNMSTKSARSEQGEKSGTDSDLGKQAVLAFLQQMPNACPSNGVEHPSLLKIQVPQSLQKARRTMIDKIVEDSISNEQCYSILREMEMEEDNNCTLDLHKEMEMPDDSTEQAREQSSMHQLEEYGAEFPTLSKANSLKQKWGPTQATRCSTRVAPSGKSILEKAQELKQVKDLETARKDIQG